MGNYETHDLAPVRDDERKELNLSRKVTYKQFCKVRINWILKLIATAMFIYMNMMTLYTWYSSTVKFGRRPEELVFAI